MAEQTVEQSVEQPTTPAPSSKPEGYDQVDFNALGLDQEKAKVVEGRFNRIYGQMKSLERAFRQSVEDNKALFSKVEDLSKTSQERTAEQIKGQIKAAAEAGEFEKLATLTEELVKATSTTAAPKAPEAKKEAVQEQTPRDLSEVLTADEEAQLRVWAQEQDEQGQFKRPWLNPAHPKNARALKLIEAVIADNEVVGAQAKMAEVDRLMGVEGKSQPRVAPVLNPSVTGNRGTPSGKITLTQAQKAVADAMGVAHDKYALVLSKTSRKGNGEMDMAYRATK